MEDDLQGAAARNMRPDYYIATAPIAAIGQRGVRSTSSGTTTADRYEHDVQLEVLLADYTMRLENVPTLIE